MKKRVIISMVASLVLSFSLALTTQASGGKITQTQNDKLGLVDINAHAEGETPRPH